MQLEVVGFARGRNTPIANLADAAPVDPAEWGGRSPQPGRLLFLIGTSSECGKTTFTMNLNLAIKRQCPDIRTAGIKACGTGSNRDKQAMLDASYDCAVDFVDCGLATTYEIAPSRYGRALNAMLNYSQARSDLVVTEIGGDFLEGNAPEALRILSKLNPACVLQVNDAMGAFEGLRRLAALGLRPLAIGCFRQNLMSLGARLAAEGYGDIAVVENRDQAAMDALVGELHATDGPTCLLVKVNRSEVDKTPRITSRYATEDTALRVRNAITQAQQGSRMNQFSAGQAQGPESSKTWRGQCSTRSG